MKINKLIKMQKRCEMRMKGLGIALKWADNGEDNVKIRLTKEQAKDIYRILENYNKLLNTIISKTRVKTK